MVNAMNLLLTIDTLEKIESGVAGGGSVSVKLSSLSAGKEKGLRFTMIWPDIIQPLHHEISFKEIQSIENETILIDFVVNKANAYRSTITHCRGEPNIVICEECLIAYDGDDLDNCPDCGWVQEGLK